MKLKHIPNILTFTRIILAIALIFIRPILGTISFIVYCIAGITDTFDGFFARRIPDGKSKIGADLDSIADLVLILVGAFVLLPVMEIWDWLWFAAIGALIFRLLTASVTGLIKHKKVLLIHTWASKFGSFALFVVPILYFIIGENIFMNIVALIVIAWEYLVAIEEGLINLLLKEPSTNIAGIWKVREENAKV